MIIKKLCDPYITNRYSISNRRIHHRTHIYLDNRTIPIMKTIHNENRIYISVFIHIYSL